ncbi:MAG: hypothetical protein IPJ71_13285 [Bdellovibrionales bacterium]|nr:hypothetical protein [Bdellovibrionales bacterium]
MRSLSDGSMMKCNPLLFSLVLIIGEPAKGSSWKDYCRQLLGGYRNSSSFVVEALPRIESLELPPRLRKAVRQIGAPMGPHLRGRQFSLTGYSPTMKLHPAAMGEGLQAHFIAKLIRAIEPNVEFRGYDDVDSKTDFIMIHDPWQGTGGSEPRGSGFPRGEWGELIGYHSLAMPLLKAANASYSNLPQEMNSVEGLRSPKILRSLAYMFFEWTSIVLGLPLSLRNYIESIRLTLPF